VQKDDFGVWRFWETVRWQFPSFGFQHSFGLGVLLVGKDQPTRLRQLADGAQSDAISFSSLEALAVFRSLGQAILDIADRDASLRDLRVALQRTEALVAERDENEAARAKLASRLASRQSYMIARERHLRATEKALREASMLANDQLAGLDTAHAAKERLETVAAHRLALLRAERHLRVEAEGGLAQTEALIADLRFQIARTEAKYSQIVTSTSWRVTAPLRALLMKIRPLGTSFTRSSASVPVHPR
jgi:hypothetical protein